MLKIYRYREDFGRMGSLEGVFVADEQDVVKAMGQRAYLGEVLGKHSDVSASLNSDTIKEISDDQVIVDFFHKQLGDYVGTDVLGALTSEDEDDDEDNEEEEEVRRSRSPWPSSTRTSATGS